MPLSNSTLQQELFHASARLQTRRHFMQTCGMGLGVAALSQFEEQATASAGDAIAGRRERPAKSIIYLHMAGSPPQHELFDYKPELAKHHLEPCPDELIEGKTFAFIKGKPKLLGPVFPFRKYGNSGMMLGEKIPHIGSHADELCLIRSMHTDQFNHAPAQLLLHTGTSQFGGASMGSWATYGLGSENENLPGFMVMVSGGKMPSAGKSLWGGGFLPSVFQGVQCRGEGDPILYVNNPKGMSSDLRRASLDALNELNRREYETFQDPETLTRIEQYELAFRMQTAVPDVMDISREPQHTLDAYGAQPGAASFANNCLLARRLVEQGVRFVQLFDWGWDIHGTAAYDDMHTQLVTKCNEADKPIGALLTDLKQRGLLDDTLVIFGGEFGRTPMVEARNGTLKFLGRDHHPDCFSVWVAGGGFKGGHVHGSTDELGFKVAENGVDVKDFQATILHAMGLDPYRLSFASQGLNQRLIGPANTPKIVSSLLS
ncbi:hypothetical protein Pla22_00730 [Rubripirellula amarantea]|uniref:Sulfatase n=1 Tax=Rubripirellula amarantea TaxID=2527999 RepID=A0A5C5WQL7_9BACT|nr:DUF1501 domain-containing protein [Rubripirellula amarantea]TWT52449.1 hypothetical protein Pla22_00730 [Rubripirellula amarantea]